MPDCLGMHTPRGNSTFRFFADRFEQYQSRQYGHQLGTKADWPPIDD